MYLIFNTIILSIALFFCSSRSAYADCPGYSWIVEYHSKRNASNCKSSALEIDRVLSSIKEALKSNRTVDLNTFGQFTILTRNRQKSKLKRIAFKADKDLILRVNEK